jgi:hypothetical protein
MTARERFHAIMNFQSFDRLPLLEWAFWWDKTIERWRGEGLPREAQDRDDICRHFGLELYKQEWVRPERADFPRVPEGQCAVRTMEDYERIRRFLYPRPAVDPAWWRACAEEQRRGEIVLWFTLDGFFWFPRKLFGIERHLYAFYDQPELMRRINEDLAAWHLQVIDEICAIVTPDFMTFAEDLSYNHGPMLSRELYDRFVKPYTLRGTARLRERGILSIVDSDGDVTACAPWFESAGINGILPLERQAGVDVARLRRENPRLRFIGAFDKMTMNRGEAALRAEFERLLPVARTGGFLISCDHQTPPGVSYDQYRLYLRLFNEYSEKAGS